MVFGMEMSGWPTGLDDANDDDDGDDDDDDRAPHADGPSA